MTRRPELVPENYEAIYEYYKTPHTREWINTAWHALGERLYRPDVVMSDITEREIRAQLQMGKGALVASNHPSGHDVLVLPGALRASGIEGLQETGALAKDSLFHGLVGIVSEATGSIPVFRQKSHPDATRSDLAQAGLGAVKTAAHRLRNHQSVVVMPEGTNSTEEALTQLTAKDIQAGIARIAVEATDRHSFILPVGISYTSNRHRKLPPRHPVVVLGRPITIYEHAAPAVKGQVLRGMQIALNRANNYQSESN